VAAAGGGVPRELPPHPVVDPALKSVVATITILHTIEAI
jgi:hypothetical protein